MFTTTADVYSWLYNERKAAKREDLSRIKRCVELLNIQMNYKIVHIAGTNGKGSVATDIKSILSLTGMHVGFFVSPYVISFNERIQINDRYISDAEIMHYANKLYDFSNQYKKEYKDTIPFFELTLLMALFYFQDRNIDVAIMECGLGGLLDATNFIQADLSIITNIGYDHMAQLGNTLESIASHKLGIVKENGYLITAVDEALYPEFISYTKKKNAKVQFISKMDISDIQSEFETSFIYKDKRYTSSLIGEFQAVNAAIAIEAVEYITPSIPYDIVEYGLSHVKWPGRMELIRKSPDILLDGGHNISAIKESTKALLKIKRNRKVKVIFTSLQDKDYTSMIEELDKVSDFYYFTSIVDLRRTNPAIFKDKTKKESIVIEDMEECIKEAVDHLKDDEILFITGSLHFISLAREKFLK